MKKVVLLFLLCSTAASAQRYSGSRDIGTVNTNVVLNGHGIGSRSFPIDGEVTASMDLTVDDSQSVIFHEFRIDIDGRFDVANNVYGLISGSLVIDEHLDLNPIAIDDQFHIRPFAYSEMDIVIEWHNRNFTNTVEREFTERAGRSSQINELFLDYENYPESIALGASNPRQIWFQSHDSNRQALEIEPELELTYLAIELGDIRNQIALLAVDPTATVPMLENPRKANLHQILRDRRQIAVPEPNSLACGVMLLFGFVQNIRKRKCL